MDRILKIVTWNVNELTKHSQKMKTLIFSQNIDILLVSEARHIYIMFPDGKTHGGAALIIKSNVRHYKIGKHQRDFLQAINGVVEHWNASIIISTVYSPPKHIIKSEQYITFFKTLANHLIQGIIIPNRCNTRQDRSYPEGGNFSRRLMP